jgi:hypothetical protein
MFRKFWIPGLLVVALLTLAYAIYRSTARRITVLENGHETVYGEPQHGLVLGLCLFSAVCIIGAVALLIDSKNYGIESKDFSNKEPQVTNRRTF